MTGTLAIVVVLAGFAAPEPTHPAAHQPALTRAAAEASVQRSWTRRHRGLIAGTATLASLTVAGIAMATLPWIGVEQCHQDALANDTDDWCGMFPTIMTGVGVPVAVGAAIGLGFVANKLARHRRDRPPRLSIGLGRGGLAVRF